MQRMAWVDRKFRFDIPPGWLLNVVARLEGTETRLLQLMEGRPEDVLSMKPDGKWSVKEHIGHLKDLEELHHGRLHDFRDRKPVLRAADMSNKATEYANHNLRQVSDLIGQFSIRRDAFIEELLGLDEETHLFQSRHPRLDIMMKPVDMASFTAEHDDHHIASIMEILHKHGL
jgi:hypothetical protein